MVELKAIAEALIDGDAHRVKELTDQALAENLEPRDILQEGFIAGMNVVGVRFRADEMFVPEVLASAMAMKAGMASLKPVLTASKVEAIGKVVIGTVQGDVHDIGKNLVVMMLEGAGFDVTDLGVDVPPEKFLDTIRLKQPQVLALSALYSPTMLAMEDVIKLVKKEGLGDSLKIIVGGAPVTQKFADMIHADAYAPDSQSAVEKVKELMAIPV